MRTGLPVCKGVVTAKRKETFGDRLRQALEASTLGSQTELAGLLEVRVSTVNAWAQDGALPEGKYMVRLPGLLDVSGHWLLTGEKPMKVPSAYDGLRLEVIGVVRDGRLDEPTLRRILDEARPVEDVAEIDELLEGMNGSGDGPP